MKKLVKAKILSLKCPSVKERIVKAVREQAESMLGMSMTFSLFEWLKDNHAALLEGQDLYFQDLKSGIAAKDATADLDKLALDSNPEKNSKKKDSGMTKNQKRRMWDRQNAAGERDRGWNWIDVVKHLSQSGSAGTS
ncbi:hypothetical protein HAZT_HAZT010577 [Hyalella azteca]|uniref:RWD domain-containing protein n=1 Tax=Hyalella azteca TaxID=294128 RepID=A0A6A0H012_HYAAZ|nr:hypothetical protein HAZT_HAZT010577 [Hyalella azteca]